MSNSTDGTNAIPPSPLPAVPSLNNTFGAFLLGSLIGVMLHGLTVHQTYRYFSTYRSDVALLKALVIALFLVDAVHSILCVHICYYYLVTSYFQPLALLNGVWSIQLLTPVMSFVIVLSQGFYMRRVYLINTRYIFIVVLAGLFMACEIAFKHKAFAGFSHFAWLSSAAFSFVLPTDVLLTGTLIAYLRRSRTGFRQTDSMLNVLIVYTVNTGLLTGTLNLISLIMALVFPDNMIYFAFSILTTKSYANAVMAVLNSRQWLTGSRWTIYELGTFGVSTVLQQHSQPSPAVSNSWRPSSGRVEVIDMIAAARAFESSSSRNVDSDTTASQSTEDGDESFQELDTFKMTDVGEPEKDAAVC